ncbi:MAG TPA: thiamine pyrophosphate-binding protein, partial [Anaeromyxobacteraceae bacterium]
MTGSEALARGAAEEGVQLVAGCPVPPIAALLDAAEREAVLAERTPTGKVALEVAMGACLAGARAVAALPCLAA